MLCKECDKKTACTELCKRAEKWVNRDYVYQREKTVPKLVQNLTPHSFSELTYYFSAEKVSFPFLTSVQNKILYLFYFQGLSYVEIARNLKINKKKVDNCLYSAKCQILGFFHISEGVVILCRKCKKSKPLTDKPYCKTCMAEFQAWLGAADFHLSRMEYQREYEDLVGYEDDQWKEFWE